MDSEQVQKQEAELEKKDSEEQSRLKEQLFAALKKVREARGKVSLAIAKHEPA